MTTFMHYIDRFVPGGLLAHLSTVAGFILAFFLVARLMSERRAPANTFAWLLVIVFIPWLGVPLYLLLGGRKLRRLAKDKKTIRGSVHFVLATRIGATEIVSDLESGMVLDAIKKAIA